MSLKEMKENKDKDAKNSGIKPTEPVISPDFRQQTFTTKITTSMERTYLVADRYLLLEKLGKGGFGLIYSGIDVKTGTQIAIKLEDISKAKKKYLKLEHKIYERYHSNWFYLPFKEEAYIPNVYHYGQEGGFRVLVMDLLGPSLAELLTFQFERFSIKTTCMLAIKMITAVELLHAKGILHRDIKPGNFVMGRGKNGNNVYLIDYGLASSYLDVHGNHIPYNTNARFHGTDKYASINNHNKIEPSRRDDMESLGYLLVYYLTSNLPWAAQYSRVKKQHRRTVYGKAKMQTTVEQLTKDLPSSFHEYFTYVSKLAFLDKPDYDYLRKLFYTTLEKHDYVFDNVFDWSLIHIADTNFAESSC